MKLKFERGSQGIMLLIGLIVLIMMNVLQKIVIFGAQDLLMVMRLNALMKI